MALSPVSKLNLVSLDKHKEKIIELLHNFGVVQIEDWEEKEKIVETSETSPEYLCAQVVFALNFLNRWDETKIPLKDKLFKGKTELTEKELKKIVNEFDYRKIINECENLEAKLNEQNSIIDRHKADKELLEPWQTLTFIPAAEIETAKTKTLLGSLTQEAFEELIRQSEKFKEIILQKSQEINREVFLGITFDKKIEKKIRDILIKLDFKPAQVPSLSCLPLEKLKTCDKEIEKANKEIEKTTKEIKKLSRYLNELHVVSDYLNWKKEQKEALDKSISTEKTFALLFWIEDQYLEILKKELDKITKEYEIEKMPIKKGESVPVILKNKSLVEPFESVTGIYGMPLKSEIDPTPYLAPFFFVFFGFCVSDAGYGIVITVIMSIIYKLMKKPAHEKKLIKLLIFGGIATIISGTLFGSWFGIDVNAMSDNWFKGFVLSLKVIDPVKDPITLLLVAFVFGIIQIMTGLLINTYWKIKQKKVLDGLLGSGLWFFALLILVLWVLAKVNVLPASFGTAMTYVLLVTAIAIVIANGRKTKNIFLKIPIGLYALYDVIGYLSDTLSYARLLALGLATGIIAMVINLIAGLAIDMLPFFGYILAILILIGGHLFNMGINALGGFIHSGRLQFVEFFPKFLEGGGARFKPFKKTSKYIRVINK